MQHHPGTLINVAAAHSQYQIPRLDPAHDIFGHFLKGIPPGAARDFFSQIAGMDIISVYFPAAHNAAEHYMIRQRQGFDEIIQQQIGAGKGEGLKYRPHLPVPQIHSGFEGSGQFSWMVAVIVGDGHPIHPANQLKTTSRAMEALHRPGDLIRRHSLHPGFRCGSHSIENVVISRNMKGQAGQLLSPMHQIKGTGKSILTDHIGRIKITFRAHAKGVFLLFHRLHSGTGVGVIPIIQHPASHVGKGRIAFHGVLHRAEILHMVVVNIQDNGHVRAGTEKMILKFTGLIHKQICLSRSAVAADGGQLASDNRGRILPGQIQNMGKYGGNGGLSMGTGDAHSILIPAGDRAQYLRPLQHGDSHLTGSRQLRIIRQDGRCIHHHIRSGQILGAVPQMDLQPHLTFQIENITFVVITAGDLISLAVKDLHQRKHTGASNSNAMDMANSLRQLDFFFHLSPTLPAGLSRPSLFYVPSSRF